MGQYEITTKVKFIISQFLERDQLIHAMSYATWQVHLTSLVSLYITIVYTELRKCFIDRAVKIITDRVNPSKSFGLAILLCRLCQRKSWKQRYTEDDVRQALQCTLVWLVWRVYLVACSRHSPAREHLVDKTDTPNYWKHYEKYMLVTQFNPNLVHSNTVHEGLVLNIHRYNTN